MALQDEIDLLGQTAPLKAASASEILRPTDEMVRAGVTNALTIEREWLASLPSQVRAQMPNAEYEVRGNLLIAAKASRSLAEDTPVELATLRAALLARAAFLENLIPAGAVTPPPAPGTSSDGAGAVLVAAAVAAALFFL